MARLLGTRETPAAARARRFRDVGATVMPPSEVTQALRMHRDEWARFTGHWQHLAPDRYAAELGVTRLRRYGEYSLCQGALRPAMTRPFVQPQNSNPLYIGRGRDFAPLTASFAAEPVLPRLIHLLAQLAAALDDPAEWTVKVHQFRVQAATRDAGLPTPEGLHRDGVTLVSSLLIRRHNALGGQSSVCDVDGRPLLRTTLAEPGTLLLGDDRRTLHQVSPIRPISGSKPARRDVLVITFASG